MDKRAVTEFFDRLAPTWDDGLIHDDGRIGRILDIAGVTAGARVLDVACGTGVLVPDYLARGAQSVTGVDISPAMIRIAAAKLTDPRVTFICGDIEELRFADAFDCCVVYNALPHFADPARLVMRLAPMLHIGGRLTIAHGMSRGDVNAHHANVAGVSRELPAARELAGVMQKYLDVCAVVSDGEIFAVSGIRV